MYQSPDSAPSSGLLFVYLRHLPLFLIVYDVFSKPASTPKTESPCSRVAMQIFILNLITKDFLMSPEFENVQLLSMNVSVSRGFETITLRLRTSQRISCSEVPRYSGQGKGFSRINYKPCSKGIARGNMAADLLQYFTF